MQLRDNAAEQRERKPARGAYGVDLLADRNVAGSTKRNRLRRRRKGKLTHGENTEITCFILCCEFGRHPIGLLTPRVRRLAHGNSLRARHDMAVRSHFVCTNDHATALPHFPAAGIHGYDDNNSAGHLEKDLLRRLAVSGDRDNRSKSGNESNDQVSVHAAINFAHHDSLHNLTLDPFDGGRSPQRLAISDKRLAAAPSRATGRSAERPAEVKPVWRSTRSVRSGAQAVPRERSCA